MIYKKEKAIKKSNNSSSSISNGKSKDVGIVIINDTSDSDSEDDIKIVKANPNKITNLCEVVKTNPNKITNLSDEDDFSMVIKQNEFGVLSSVVLSDFSPLSPFSPIITMDISQKDENIITKKQRIDI